MTKVIKIEPKDAEEKALWDKVVENFPKKQAERRQALEQKAKEYAQKSSQSPQPYSVYYEQGTYLFQTDNGLVYACAFHNLTPRLSPVLGVYDIAVKDIEFSYHDPEPEKRKPQDPRIAKTILGIMAGEFEDDSHVLIYLCDASDGRPEQRQKLFSKWHEQIADLVDHEKVRLDYGAFEVFGGVFIPKRFPYRDVLQHELMDNAKGLILEKFAP